MNQRKRSKSAKIKVKAWALTYQFDDGSRMIFATDLAGSRRGVINKFAPDGDWPRYRRTGYRVERVTITTEGGK